MNSELELLEIAIIGELEARIIELGDQVTSAMADIQPPASIAHAAAVAAAQVLMAFERGYRMDTAPEESETVDPNPPEPFEITAQTDLPAMMRALISGNPVMQESFFDAVRSDPDMSAEDKAYWLAMEAETLNPQPAESVTP